MPYDRYNYNPRRRYGIYNDAQDYGIDNVMPDPEKVEQSIKGKTIGRFGTTPSISITGTVSPIMEEPATRDVQGKMLESTTRRMMNDPNAIGGISPTQPYTNIMTQPTDTMTGNKPSGFLNFWNDLPAEQKKAISSGLMSTGFSMMAQSDQASKYPISTAGVFGRAAEKGMNEYQQTLSLERQYGLQKDYMDLQKENAELNRELQKRQINAPTKIQEGDVGFMTPEGKVFPFPTNLPSSKQEERRLKALAIIEDIDYSLAKVAKSNTVLDDKTALVMSQLLGRPVSGGSLLDEPSRLQYIDSLKKRRDAWIPYTRTGAEKAGHEYLKGNTVSLPPEIKTTSGAMKYLQQQGMSEDEAANWLRSQ